MGFATRAGSDLLEDLKTTNYCLSDYTWTEATDGNVEIRLEDSAFTKRRGTWELTGTFTTLGNDSDSIGLWINYVDADNYIVMQLFDSAGANNVYVYRKLATAGVALISSGVSASGTAEHVYTLTRDLNDFEALQDNVSIGTATNNTNLTSPYMKLNFAESNGASVFKLSKLKHTELLE